MKSLSAAEVARRVDLTPATLRRWDELGLIPRDGDWTEREVAHVKMLMTLRARGYSLARLADGVQRGALAIGFVDAWGEEQVPTSPSFTIREAAREIGLEPELLRRFLGAFGLPTNRLEINEAEMLLLRQARVVLDSGLPLVASLQIARVFGQAMAQIADVEVRLVHLYVHEPMLKDGNSGSEIAGTLDSLATRLLPLASPILDLLHQRYLQQFIEQDVVGHLEQEEGPETALGEMKVAIAFADLAGYTRLTEEQGDLEAVSVAERFFEQVELSIPDDARVIKTIGDEVMIVGSDPSALTEWAVDFMEERDERPLPRIGVHYGAAMFRDGDYYGRAVNLTARIVPRAAGGEVVISEQLAAMLRGKLELSSIGHVSLKGFQEREELFSARRPAEF